jgi:hypothetical protein
MNAPSGWYAIDVPHPEDLSNQHCTQYILLGLLLQVPLRLLWPVCNRSDHAAQHRKQRIDSANPSDIISNSSSRWVKLKEDM